MCALALTLVAGCYSGVSSTPDGDAPAASEGGGAPEDETDAPVPADPDGCPLESRRIWKLTPAQVSETVATMIPGLEDAGASLAATLPVSQGFSNDASVLAMTEPHVSDLLRFSNAMADAVVADPGAVHACLSGGRDGACVKSFVEEFASKGFRRPVTEDELAELIATYEAEDAARGEESALYQVVRAVFLSPHFLYRTELGTPVEDGVFALTAHERAASLSYLLTDGPPDDALREAADAGALDSPEGFRAQVDRLLASPQTGAGLVKLIQEHLHSRDLDKLTKDREVVPDFDAELARAIADENRAFIEHVLWSDDGRWSSVLTAPYSIVGAAVAELYGIEVDSAEPSLVDLPGERAGIMTQPGMMAALSRTNTTDPVARGKFVREVLLCQPVPPPPPEVGALPPPADESKTKREQLEIHREDETCAACHDILDPPGLAFEHYDLLGRHRLEEHGMTIDASGALELDGGGAFTDAVDMMTLIAEDPRSQECLADAVFRYVSGHQVHAADQCALEVTQKSAVERDGDVRELVADVLTAERFVLRAGDEG